MEPNNEDIIRRKIQEAEQIKVSWNKELVWSAIVRKPAGKSRMLVFYYVAASFTLAIALFIFSTERTKQKELALQLAELELAIEKQRALSTSATLTKHLLTTFAECKEEEIISAERKTKKHIPVRKENTTIKTAVVNPIVLLVDAEVPVQEKESISRTTVLSTLPSERELTNQPTETVTAIIGTEWESVAAKSTKEKRLQFRLFQSEEETSKSTGDPVYILAHINQH
jgi:hypothetical protein